MLCGNCQIFGAPKIFFSLPIDVTTCSTMLLKIRQHDTRPHFAKNRVYNSLAAVARQNRQHAAAAMLNAQTECCDQRLNQERRRDFHAFDGGTQITPNNTFFFSAGTLRCFAAGAGAAGMQRTGQERFACGLRPCAAFFRET